MILGHWYLVIPSMEVAYLQSIVKGHIGSMVARIVVVGVAVGVGCGALIGWIGVCLDLTSQREAANAAAAGHERFRVAFGIILAASAFALVFDLDTKLQTWLPNWTSFLQDRTEASASGRTAYCEPNRYLATRAMLIVRPHTRHHRSH